MPRPRSLHPTELELEFLKILWGQLPKTVREIRDELASRGRDIAHTSVITTLNTMVDKKFLNRKKQGKSFLFSPRIQREKVSQQMLGSVVDRVFDGSAKAVVLSLFDVADVDTEELKELRKLINQKVRENDQ